MQEIKYILPLILVASGASAQSLDYNMMVGSQVAPNNTTGIYNSVFGPKMVPVPDGMILCEDDKNNQFAILPDALEKIRKDYPDHFYCQKAE